MYPITYSKKHPYDNHEPLCHWQTPFYHITLVASQPLQAIVRSLQSQKVSIVAVSATFAKLSPSNLLANQKVIQEVFYARVIRAGEVPVRVEFFTRGLGGSKIYTQKTDPLPNIPKGDADVNRVPKSAQEIVWVMRQLKPDDSRSRLYRECAIQFLSDFEKSSVHSKEQVDGLVLLVLLDDEAITRAVINHLIQKIKNDVLLNLDLVEALADAIDRAMPAHLNPDDLVQLLLTVIERIKKTHSTAKLSLKEQLKAVARIINAMADTNKCKIPRETHLDIEKKLESFEKSLDDFTGPHSQEVRHFANYAKEAFKRVSDDETNFAAFVRHTTGIVQGAYHLWMAFRHMDPQHVVNGLLALKANADDLIKFALELGDKLGAISDLKEGGMKLKEGLTFVRVLRWYEQMRYIELLIDTNSFQALELFLYHPNLAKHPSLMYLTVEKLHEVVLTHPDLTIRQETIVFLRQIYLEEARWSGLQLQEGNFKYNGPSYDIFNRTVISQWIALKGLLIECLQQYQTIPELKSTAAQAIQEIEKQANSHPEESKFIQRHRTQAPDLQLPTMTGPKLIPEQPHKEMSLELRLERMRAALINDDSFQKEQRLYVAPMGAPFHGSESLFELMQEVLSFLKGDQRVLLLLGDSGSGKTLFCQMLAAYLWQQYQPISGAIPLYISLPSLRNPTHNLFPEFMKRKGFSREEISMLKEHRELIFILDGLDEIPKDTDILEGNQLVEFKGKIIVTCRTEAQPCANLFVPTIGGKPKRSLLKEIYLAPFSAFQIDQYIEKCDALGNTEGKHVSLNRSLSSRFLAYKSLCKIPLSSKSSLHSPRSLIALKEVRIQKILLSLDMPFMMLL